jgi:hypothetical protein
LHDHKWPGRRLANIDHVTVGPGGVFVIDSKNWSGDIRVVDQVLRQNGRSRENAVAGVADAGLAVAELVAAHAHVVQPVLCFTGERPLAGWVRDVMICSTHNVADMLKTRHPVLSPNEVREIATQLDARLRGARVLQPVARPSAKVLAERRVASSRTPSRPARPVDSRGRQRSATSLSRLLILLLAAGLLMSSIPTVLPAVAGLVSDYIVSVATNDRPNCLPDEAAAKKVNNGQGSKRTAKSASPETQAPCE